LSITPNILQAYLFEPILFCQKITNLNRKHIKAAQTTFYKKMLAKLTPCRKMSVESTPDHHYSDVRLCGTKSKQFFSVEERESSISPELFTTAIFF